MAKRRIRFSVENLYHFKCEVCGFWWSIGDWASYGNRLCCPQCGEWSLAEPIERLEDHCEMCGRERFVSWNMDESVWKELCETSGWDKRHTNVCIECVAKMLAGTSDSKLTWFKIGND